MFRSVAVMPVLALVMLVSFMGTAQALPITTPTLLGSGESYRLMFRTLIARDALSADIADYNAFVTGVANSITELASLGTTWTAVASTATVDARDNTGTNPFTDGVGEAIYLLDGTTKIADNYADLWDGSIDAFINRNENGDLHTGGSVWTGSQANGTGQPFAQLGAATFGFAGLPNATNSNWLSASAPALTTELTFFAISGVLPAADSAVPVPAALPLMLVGLLGLSRSVSGRSAL